jgi:hypothetical protein
LKVLTKMLYRSIVQECTIVDLANTCHCAE